MYKNNIPSSLSDADLLDIMNNLNKKSDLTYKEIRQNNKIKAIELGYRQFANGLYSFDFKKLLNTYSKERIQKISNNLKMKLDKNDPKDEYINKFIENYNKSIKDIVYLFDYETYSVINKIIKNKGIQIINYSDEAMKIYETCMNLIDFGVLFQSSNDEDVFFIMPDNVQNLLKEIISFSYNLEETAKQNSKISSYFNMIINDYEVVSGDDLVRILKTYIDDFYYDKLKINRILKFNINTTDNFFSRMAANDIIFISKYIKIGRNEPCPCGSGKKYKKCCGK